MENRKELLEQYMEDGKLPLKGELFARKSVVGGKLEEFREEKRADALTSRPNAAGRQKLIVLRSSCGSAEMSLDLSWRPLVRWPRKWRRLSARM